MTAIPSGDPSEADDAFVRVREARDLLLHLAQDYDGARGVFAWPLLDQFNWGRDWFDRIAADEETGRRAALRVVEEDGTETSVTFAEMAMRSSQVGAWLQSVGVRAG